MWQSNRDCYEEIPCSGTTATTTYGPDPTIKPKKPLLSPLAVGLLSAAGACLLITLLMLGILSECRMNRKWTSEPKPKKTMFAGGGPPA